MALTAGIRIGPYEITGSLGAGGMGEVYRARDSKLGRNVAIKVLPALFAGDPERRTRFEREARALASLNHPNIAQIYGVEETDASPAIVMELIEGEDLADRIARGPVPWDEALPIARQIAGALDAAHERDIVHRDLKPANIKVTPDGEVRVLDFGLAKAMSGSDTSAPDPQNSPTLTAVSTRMGVIVGTAAYMSPEQAKGKTVDKRVDIWAFGCVLYEMLTGRSPFGSDSVAESIGLVVTRDPDWGALPAPVPPAVVQLISRCLLKDPKQRLRDIGEASYILARAGEADPTETASPVAGRGTRRFLLGIGVTALAVGAASAAVAWYVKPTSQVPVRRFELPAVIAGAPALAISPDGTRLAYVSDGHLFVRDLQETRPRDLGIVPANAAWLFWSPDGRTVGFTGEGTIRTVPAAGGPMFTVCRIPPTGRVMGIAWRADNMIVFSSWRDSLYQVQATGGTPEVLLPIDPATEVDFHAVSIMPDGRLVVGVHVRDGDSDRAVLVDGTNRTVLTDDRTVRRFSYVHPGFLLFLRTGANQGLWALPFSAGPLDLSRAVLVEPGTTLYSAADDGTVVSRAESPALSSLVWLNRDGSTTDVPGSPLEELSSWLALSPDGQRVAYIAGPIERPNLAVRDLASGVDTHVTLNATSERNLSMWTEMRYPSWFPTGDRLVYAYGPVEGSKVLTLRADGGGSETALTDGHLARTSRDGRLLVWIVDERGGGRLRYAPIDATGKLGQAKDALPGSPDVDVRRFDLSPDGGLLAYSVNESERSNVYLAEFPEGARWQLSTGGGTHPRFSRDGRELFFASGTRTSDGGLRGRLMVVPLTLTPAVRPGVARPVFEDKGGEGVFDLTRFDVAVDGRVLVPRALAPRAATTRAVLLQNWPATMGRR